MNKDTIIEVQKPEIDKTRQIRKGYAVELKRKNSMKGIKFYVLNIYYSIVQIQVPILLIV